MTDLDQYFPGSKRKRIIHRKSTPAPEPTETPDWDRPPVKQLMINNVVHDCFGVGQLALALGRRPVTIRKWESLGLLPFPTVELPVKDVRARRRLYTRSQVEGIVKIAREEGLLGNQRRDIRKTNFTARVIDLFKEPLS